MAVPKRKTSKSRRNKRRSHHQVPSINIIEDNRNDDELIEFALGRENLKKASASSEDLKSGSEKS